MAEMNIIEALKSSLDDLMKRDPNVLTFGEDVGYFGGVFRVTDGLQEKYGAHRVFDTPLAEVFSDIVSVFNVLIILLHSRLQLMYLLHLQVL